MQTQASPPAAGSRRSRRKATPVYWLWSLGFHGIVLVWLVFFSPVRIIDLQARKTQSTASNAKIAEVMNYVREHQADLLQSRVEELMALQQELAALEARKKMEFSAFMNDFAQTGGDKIQEAQAAADKAIAEALAAQKTASNALAEAQQSGDTNAWAAATAAQKQAQDAQSKALQNMERAVQALALTGPAMDAARQAQVAAQTLQAKADQTQTEANDHRETSKYTANDATRRQEAVAKAEAAVATATQDAEVAATSVVTNKTALADAETAAARAKAATEAAKTAAQIPGLSKEEAKAARTEADEASRDASQAQRQVTDTANRLKSAERKAESAGQKIEQSKTKLAQAQIELQKAQEKQETARQTAAAAQAQAMDLQQRAQVAQARARVATATAQAALAASGNAAAPVPDSAPIFIFNTNLNNLDLAGLYQAAVQTETAMTEVYREVRATDLAMIRQIPLAKAKELTDVAKTVRPDLAAELRRPVQESGEVAGVREAVQTAANEINAMVNGAYTMLATAKGIDQSGSGSGQGASLSLEGIYARADQAQRMEELAAEDANARAKDLAGAMSGAGQGAQGAGAAGAGQGAGRGGAGGAPAGPGRPGWGAVQEPPHFTREMPALPGRKVTSAGRRGGWVYVDSWYIIGPWDNANRANIETKFPPETVVDLDAVYVGKDSQQLRWDFHQAAEPGIMPPFKHFHPERRPPGMPRNAGYIGLEYIIYYAYTELYFDQPQDLWIAVGSDDYSKLWIEDQLVWASGKQQKAWRADEGLRRVHFKKGVNRVLFRVENGWHETMFSLCLHMGDKN